MLKLLVVYLSITGQTRKFIHKLDYPLLEITPDSVFTEVQEPYIVVVPTYEKEATEIVNEFIEVGNNRHYFKGVAGGGNRNFNTLLWFYSQGSSPRLSSAPLALIWISGIRKWC